METKVQDQEGQKDQEQPQPLRPIPKWGVCLAYIERFADEFCETIVDATIFDCFELIRRTYDTIIQRLSSTSEFCYSLRYNANESVVPIIQIITNDSAKYSKALQFIGPCPFIKIEQVYPFPYVSFSQLTS